ncbi:hypothetical protein COF84_25735 [Bacillus wiedmannii]|uniref:HNH endonuclease n=1 Tax=Bacillus wiedmannii TaxID=1890302 RepID=UPI000BFE4E37|nr:hypothetical protein [Bacillus wiedmannii]PHF12381.1 hypothetical protein COF84_25735 [Bacillus wiedmannii]
MFNYVLYKTDDIKMLEEIINLKDAEKKKRLNRMKNLVRQRYMKYSSNTTDLQSIPILNYSFKTKNVLENCYSSKDSTNEKKILGELIKNIKDLQSPTSKCPYCSIGENDSTDHYLPKSLFPEFSVYSRNLVPACKTCNSRKSAKWLNIRNSRRIANVYFDDIADKRILFAHFSYPMGVTVPKVSFKLKKPATMDSELFSVVSSHFAELSLFKRYANESVNEVLKFGKFLNRCGKSDVPIETVIIMLEAEAEAKRDTYGLNYYKASIIDQLVEEKHYLFECYSQKLII